MSDNCKHEKYTATTNMVVVKLEEIKSYQMVIKFKAYCTLCRRPFTFQAQHGFSTREPTISNDSTELRVPVNFPDDGDVPTTQNPPEGIVH